MHMPVTAFDEMTPASGQLRRPYEAYNGWLSTQEAKNLLKKSSDAESVFRRTGITFAVYGDEQADERLIPFDIIPRIISDPNGANWHRASSSASWRSMRSSTISIIDRKSSKPGVFRAI